MDTGLVTLIGMSIAYVASFLGPGPGLVDLAQARAGGQGEDR